MRYYIAGPMTGVTDWNYPAFFDAGRVLAAMGHESENPADNDGPTLELSLAGAHAAKDTGATWADYMRRDLPRVGLCDGVVVLPGWQRSRGASLEVDIAQRLGMPILCLVPSEMWEDGEPQLVPRIRAIGLSGYARAGKDTVGQILVDEHGYIRASFADKLKELALLIDPALETRQDHHGDIVTRSSLADVVNACGWENAKDYWPEVRRLLQAIGTGVRDTVGPNTWVDLAMRDLPDGSKVVFTDCRFPSEADAIRAAGGALWRIERPGFGPVNGHISETALDGHTWDSVIPNAGTLDFLRLSVRMCLAKVEQ